MITIDVSDEIRKSCPCFAGAALFAKVKNTQYSPGLWKQINECVAEYKAGHGIEDVKTNPVIAATREAYKKLGKDPNRYRPSAEALCRRIVRQLPLYQINTLVDMINLVSIRTGFSIGGFDAAKIQGDRLTLGIGAANEPYEAIGRGMLNIEGLPVYRDIRGGIGTPTSDNERTKIGLTTTAFLAIFNGYNGKEGLSDAVDRMKSLLKDFAEPDDEVVCYF